MEQDLNFWSFDELDSAQTPEVARIPDGDYSVQITKVDLTASRRSGLPQIMLNFEVIKDKDGGAEYRGKKGNTFISLDKSNAWAAVNFKQLCQAVGATKELTGRDHPRVSDFVGRTVAVRLKTQEYTKDDGTQGQFYTLQRYKAL